MDQHFQTQWQPPQLMVALLCQPRNPAERRCVQQSFQNQHLLETCDPEPTWPSPTTARKRVFPLAQWGPLIRRILNRSQRGKSRRLLSLPLRSIAWHLQRSQKMLLVLRCVPASDLRLFNELTQYWQKALETHIHILWGLSNANTVPTDPPALLLKTFETRFSMLTESDLYEQVNNGLSLLSPSLVQIAVSIPSNSHSKLAASIKQMEEHILEYMQTCLLKFGLWRWCPDFCQSPYSLYNAACQIVALDTFKQALISHSYAHFNPNIAYTKNLAFLVWLYDHVVHHYIYSRYKQDIKKPGSVHAADSAISQLHSSEWHGHDPWHSSSNTWFQLATACLNFLQDNCYPQRYLDLIDPKTTSDDEPDSENCTENGRLVYWIRKRPERSEAANLFIRNLDEKRESAARFDGSWRWWERLRVVPQVENQKETLFLTLPLSIPVDYFDPIFFN